MSRTSMRVTVLLALALALLAGSCKELQDVFCIDTPLEKQKLTGQNAFLYLEKDYSRSPAVDTTAIMAGLRIASADGGTSGDLAPGDDVVDMLQKGVRPRQGIKARKFELLDFSGYVGGPRDGGVPRTFVTKHDEYMVPNVNALPVRNQGMRGTCAAFTGTAAVEFAVLDANPALQTVDLSEQRFYYLSKPFCQDTGCDLSQEGSWYTDGMNASLASSGPDIPLEKDCPYNMDPGANDLQVPQPASCEEGAVKVVQLEYVMDQQEIIQTLETTGMPVPYASQLSENWYYNSGLITKAGSNATSVDMHAVGHAYLIVGYRLLPDMPEEGGICFIVRNSWGEGWGLNGYACQTAAWMDAWGFPDTQQPVVMDVMLRDDLAEVIDDQPDYEPPPDDYDEETYDDETVDWNDYDEGDEENIPDPAPEPEPPEWSPAALRGPSDEFFKLEIGEGKTADTLRLRGFIRNTGTPTGVLELTVKDDGLYMDFDQVGDVNGDEITLCTGPYDVLCALRLNKKTNALYVEFINPEYRKPTQEELSNGAWNPLDVPLLDSKIEYFLSQDVVDTLCTQKMMIRLVDSKGAKTDPMRLTLDGFDIRLMGHTIGSVSPDKMGLCSGSYSKSCSLFVGRRGLTIVPWFLDKQE